MYKTLILLLTISLVSLASSSQTTPQGVINTPTHPEKVVPSGFQTLPKRAPARNPPVKQYCQNIMIKAVSAANGQQEQQLLTANCVIPGSKGLKQYSQLNLDKCLGWRRTNDGGGALVALKNGGGLSKKGGQCSKCRYLQSSPNLICNCAGVRQDQKTYVDPATATWMGPVLFDLDAVLLSGKPLIEVTGQGLLACHGVV